MTALVPALAELHEAHKARQERLSAPRVAAIVDRHLVAARAPKQPAPPDLDEIVRRYRLAYSSDNETATGKALARSIISDVSRETGIPIRSLIGPSRIASLAESRQFAMWRIAKETRLSLGQIGTIFGKRDHTTVLHAVRKFNAIMGADVRGTGTLRKTPAAPVDITGLFSRGKDTAQIARRTHRSEAETANELARLNDQRAGA